MLRLLLVLCLIGLISLNAEAQKRIALLIGNSDHTTDSWDLTNPENDVAAMAVALESVGFEVHTLRDATQEAMEQAFQAHGQRLKAAGPESIGLFFFAGHGIQNDGLNFLIPVDAEIFSEADILREAPRLGDLFLHLNRAGNAMNFVILDACRDNPMPRSFRGGGRGLGRETAVRGTLIAYATEPGDVAADGGGENSPYTTALAALIPQPGLSVESLFRTVATRVEAITEQDQLPWFESGLRGEADFCFAGCETLSGTPEAESADLGRALASGSIPTLQAFLRQYPNTKSRSLVEASITRIESPDLDHSRSTGPAGSGRVSHIPAPVANETWEQYAGLVIPGCEADPFAQEELCQANKIAWSPDGALLAAATSDGMIRVFDPITGREIKSWASGYDIAATDLAWSPDSRELVALSRWNSEVKVFHARTGTEINSYQAGNPRALVWDRFSEQIVVLESRAIIFVETGESLNIGDGNVIDAAVGPNFRSIARRGQLFGLGGSAGDQPAAFVLGLPTVPNGEEFFSEFQFPDRAETGFASPHVASFAFSPDASQAVVGRFDGWVTVHDVETGNILLTLIEGETSADAPASAINAVDWSADGQRILVTDEDPRVRIFDASTGQQTASLEANTFNTDDATFNPAGDRIAVASIDGTLRLWRLLP